MKDIEKSKARIVEKYPKFLSKFALFAIQMDDALFRETFIVQVLIFTQAITDPVGYEHKNVIKITPEDTKLIRKVMRQATKLISPIRKTDADKKDQAIIKKRTFGEALL